MLCALAWRRAKRWGKNNGAGRRKVGGDMGWPSAPNSSAGRRSRLWTMISAVRGAASLGRASSALGGRSAKGVFAPCSRANRLGWLATAATGAR